MNAISVWIAVVIIEPVDDCVIDPPFDDWLLLSFIRIELEPVFIDEILFVVLFVDDKLMFVVVDDVVKLLLLDDVGEVTSEPLKCFSWPFEPGLGFRPIKDKFQILID